MATRKSKPVENEAARKFSIEERRAIFEEGMLHTLPSGVDVLLRPVMPDALLRGGTIPDILTPLVIDMLYEREMTKTNKALDEFIRTPREEAEKTLEMLVAVDAVCQAALVDPEQLPYLTYQDRAYIFRMAFLPAEVLSRFRTKQAGDVGDLRPSEQVQQAA